MHDARKTKAQLIAELTALRQRQALLESAFSTLLLDPLSAPADAAEDRQQVVQRPSHAQLTRVLSERLQAEQALAREHAFVSALLDTLGALVVTLDPQGRIVGFNRACERATGYTLADVRGHHIWDVLILREEIETVKAAFNHLRAAERWNAHTHYWVTKDGQRRLITWSNTALLDRQEAVEYVIATGIDLTEHARVETALQESEMRMQGIVETIVDALITIDEQGTIETFNAAAERIFGYQAAEVIGRNVKILMPAPYHDEHDAYLAHYLLTGERKIIGIGREVVGRRKDGSTFPMDLAVGESRLGARRLFTGIARDITERKRTLAEMQRAERLALVGQLASGLAHEIGTPLNVIAGNAELLRMERLEQNLPAAPLDVIIEQADRITGLIRQLLVFAQAKEQPAEPLVLREPLMQALRLLAARFEREAITVVVDIPHDFPLVWGMAHQIEQVFLNILVNAWHAMPAGGTITVRAGVNTDQDVWIAFRDTGNGMSEADMARAFEPFYSTKEERGTGLGLTMCQQIVEHHQGSISLASARGVGTTVTITLRQADVVSPA